MNSNTKNKTILFEASFTNLDLSEFDTTSTTNSTNNNYQNNHCLQSASQQLLTTKQNEFKLNQYNIQQEEYIQSKAKERLETYKKQEEDRKELEQEQQKYFFNQKVVLSNQSNRGSSSSSIGSKSIDSKFTSGNGDNNACSGLFYNALLSMHDNDLHGKQWEKSQKSKANGNNTRNNMKLKGGQGGRRGTGGLVKTSKGGIVKKGRQMKYTHKK